MREKTSWKPEDFADMAMKLSCLPTSPKPSDPIDSFLPLWADDEERHALYCILKKFPYPDRRKKMAIHLSSRLYKGELTETYNKKMQQKLCGILIDHLMSVGKKLGVPQAILKRLSLARSAARTPIDGVCSWDILHKSERQVYTSVLIEAIVEKINVLQTTTVESLHDSPNLSQSTTAPVK